MSLRRAVVLGLLGLAACLNYQNIDASSLKDFLAKHPLAFVQFTASWCDHCEPMRLAFDSLAEEIAAADKRVGLAMYNIADEAAEMEEYGVRSLPEFVLFRDNLVLNYKGKRETPAIFEWFQKRMKPAVKTADYDDLELIEEERIAAIYIVPEDDREAEVILDGLASKVGEVNFYIARQNSFRDRYDCPENYCFVLLRNFDEGKRIMMNEHPFDIKELSQFFEYNRYPMVGEFDQEMAERVFQQKKPAVVLFTNTKDHNTVGVLKQIAPKHFGSVVFAFSRFDSFMGSQLSRIFDLSADKHDGKVAIIGFSAQKMEKYVCPGNTLTELEKCIDSFRTKNLKQVYKSEAEPAKNDGPVKKVVGNTFESVVLNSRKPVFFGLYRKDCEGCDAAFAAFDELATGYVKAGEVVFAKMDWDHNEYPHATIEEVAKKPHFKLYLKGEKDLIAIFREAPTFENFVKFLNDNLEKEADESNADNKAKHSHDSDL